jgi:hypothetical protein
MIDYNSALASALKRKAMRDANSAVITPFKGVKAAFNETVFVRQLADKHNLDLALCVHGKVPRRVAERMNMPRVACHRCA